MSVFKQLLISLLILLAALWGALVWVPGTGAVLRGWGLGPYLDPLVARLGITEAVREVPAAVAGRGPGGGLAPRVRAQPPAEGRIADTVEAIGDGRALRSVAVHAQSPGRVAAVLVQSGQMVQAGDILLRLDSEAEEIALSRAQLVLDDARARRERVAQLRGSGASTDVQMREADLALRQAELALRQAEFNLAQRVVEAPISGWLGILTAEVGAQLGTATEIAQIDDRSALLVDFRLPERMVGRLALDGEVMAEALAGRSAPITGRISAIDNRVDPASRTLRVQARLDNTQDLLRAGMAFAIRIALPGEPAPAVDPLSVQWSREGAFVWVVREGRAARLPIRILQRSETEVLVEAAFAPGDLVIVEGVQAVRAGAPVTVDGLGETLQPASGAPGRGPPPASL